MTTPTNPQPREVLPVILPQDVERARQYWAGWSNLKPQVEDGSYHPLVYTLAAHRQAAEASAQPGEREAMRKAIAVATISLKAIGEPQPNDPPDALICAVIARSALVRMENALRAPRADIVEGEG